MKYLVVLGDGMADRPVERLGGKTLLMAAEKPSMDYIAANGRSGMFKTIPDNMPTGSAVANLGVLGYDPVQYFSGRGPLEAANLGVPVEDGDLIFRCNLMCAVDGRIKNHSAGHISTEEASRLIDTLNASLSDDRVRFYAGITFKHILVIKNGSSMVECVPPHDHPGEEVASLMVKASSPEGEETARLLNTLIKEAAKILVDHPVNIKRLTAGKDPANSIWPWSGGYKPEMPLFSELYGVKGAVISAVDLINGIGVFAGMDIVPVEGATGLYDTNYEGKAAAAIEALKTHDFVYLHVEATDEAGHEGDLDLKLKCIEYLDNRILRTVLSRSGEIEGGLAIAVLPDHPTPVESRIHTREPVPFTIMKPGDSPDGVSVYDEKSAETGAYGLIKGTEFIKILLS